MLGSVLVSGTGVTSESVKPSWFKYFAAGVIMMFLKNVKENIVYGSMLRKDLPGAGESLVTRYGLS